MQKTIVWSPLQKAIFRDVQSGTGNTVVLARAGASKTTVLVEATKYVPPKKKTIFVAFNKKIALELDERINRSYIATKTLHSVGFSTIKAHFGQAALDPDKTQNIIQNILYEYGFKKFEKSKFDVLFSLCRAVNLCKGALIDVPSKIDDLIDLFDIDTFSIAREDFIKIICKTLRKCKEINNVIDFADMVWFPYVYGMVPEKYDRVFIDEAQDLSPAQVSLALSLCKKDGRILAVGDDRQVLYSFNGVEIDAIEKLTKRLDAKVLPLSVSYRCPQKVIKLAQDIVPDIEAAPYAQEGEVKEVKEKNFLSDVRPGDFILSRVNAPLIYYCLALLRMGVPANIQGRDVGANLAYMIKKSEAKTVPEFAKWLDEWKASEIARLTAKKRDPILVIDKAACLDTLCEGARSLDEVLDNIKELFNDGDDTTRVMLSSVHKSKGLERERVFLLTNTFRRDMSVEEMNIEYVAITRSKSCLYLVIK